MSELGQVLLRAREEKEISLDDIQKITKIQRRYLEAIERGHFHVLPGHFYARAFIKSYAEAVGLDPTHILEQFQADLPAQPPQEQIERLRRRRIATSGVPFEAGRWVTQTLLVLFVVLVIGVIYMALVNNQETQPIPIPGREVIDGNGVQQPTGQQPPPIQPTTPTPSVQETQPDPANQAGGVESLPTETAEQEASVTFVSQQGSIYTYNVSKGENLAVKVKAANGECWVQVRDQKGGQVIGEALLRSGQEQVFQAPKTAYIRTGNPSAVAITINDLPLAMTNIKMMPADLDIKIQN